MDGLQLAILPLAAFWLTFKALFDAADFVNKMRDKIVSGMDGSNPIGLQHRKTMRIDWYCCVVFTALAAFLFSGLIFWIAVYIHSDARTAPASTVVGLVAFFPFVAAILFLGCLFSDGRLMNKALADAEKAQAAEAQSNKPPTNPAEAVMSTGQPPN